MKLAQQLRPSFLQIVLLPLLCCDLNAPWLMFGCHQCCRARTLLCAGSAARLELQQGNAAAKERQHRAGSRRYSCCPLVVPAPKQAPQLPAELAV